MADQPSRSPSLRAVVPTLEPDEAFLARLGSLAAAGSTVSESAAAPRTAWRVGLAAAGVAAVLVGAAWLTGLGSSDGPDPTPAPTSPATSPSSPDPASTTAAPTEGPRPTATPTASSTPVDVNPGGSVPPTSPADQPDPAGAGTHQNEGQSQDQGSDPNPGQGHGNGPDEHAGDHPDEHATEKSGNANEHAGNHPGPEAGGRGTR